MKESYVFLAEGFEEIEALTVVDVLRRAGMPVKTVSITSSLQVTGAHGVTVTADLLYDNVLFTDPLWLILPGGLPGAVNLYEFAPLIGLLERQKASAEGNIAAICAAPAEVLGRAGLLAGETATCYPGFQDKLGCAYEDRKVVSSGKFVTGSGPAAASRWALEIVRRTLGGETAEKIANGMLIYRQSLDNVDHFFG